MRWSLLLALLGLACAHARPSGVPVEEEAADSSSPEPHSSARALRHYLDALLARNADDFDTAVAELREAVLYDPGSPHLHTVLADVLLKQGRDNDAEEELKLALALDPKHAPALLLSARISMARGNVTEARERLEKAIDADPDEAEAYRDLARLLIATGEPAGAEAVAERLSAQLARSQAQAEEGPDAQVTADRLREQTAVVWVELGRYLAQHGAADSAKRAFERARSAAPSDPDALSAEAAWLEMNRRFADARDRYVRLLAQRPDAPEVLAALARVAIAEGDVDTVSAHARKLVSLASGMDRTEEGPSEEDRRDLTAALLRVAVTLMGAHRSADAQRALDAALRLYPKHPELSFYRAIAVVQRGRAREGARAFEAIERRIVAKGDEALSPAFLGAEPGALVLDARIQAALARGKAGETRESMRRVRALFTRNPEVEEVALALLQSYDRAGKAAEAEELLAAAVRSHPDSDGLLYALASAQDRIGMRVAALSTMRKVLAAQPQHTGALNYIGYTLAEQGEAADLREAETLLSRAVALRPDDSAIADSYGYCLLRLGRPDEALAELRRADRLSPGDPVILSHLGDALIASGHRDEARSVFRRALAPRRPGARPPHALADAQAMVDPRERGDRDEAKARAEIAQKLKSLSP
jgi:Flp pilus assembly protein TadD